MKRVIIWVWVFILGAGLTAHVLRADEREVLGDCLEEPEAVVDIVSLFSGPLGRDNLQRPVAEVADNPHIFKATNLIDIAYIKRDTDINFSTVHNEGREAFFVYAADQTHYIEYREDWGEPGCRVELVTPPPAYPSRTGSV